MDRAEATGLGVAAAGHVALLAILSLGFATATRPSFESTPIEVSFVEDIGLQATVTEAQTDAPAESEAPEVGPPEEAAPAPQPEPTPAPPAPTPAPKAAETPPAPKATPKEAVKQAPAKAPPKEKAPPAKAAPKETAAPKQATKSAGAGTAEKAKGSRLGADFLKGISDKSEGKAQTPRAAVSSRNLASLAQAIIAQIKPCYVVPTGGTDTEGIVTVLRIRMRPNGSVASASIEDQEGVNAGNRAYAQQLADAARRAVLRCAPLKLPADLYEGGWDDIDVGFRPGSLS